MATKIILPAEMRAAEPLIVALGGAAMTRFVGGCVRNAVLGETIGDIDLATRLVPEEVMRRLKAARIKYVPTGLDHGTITAVLDGSGFEITTLRRDVATDGRRATVAFSDNWEDDARRRDFTMNTLLADLSGNIFDPLGQGLADLKKGRVVFVGNAGQRIAEDYLRILRFFRFHAAYGRGQPDKAALSACRDAAGRMGKLSRERVTQELVKILSGRRAADTVALMSKSGILKDVFLSSLKVERFKKLCRKQREMDEAALAARFSVIAHPTRLKERLRLPLRILRLVDDILAAHTHFRSKTGKERILLSLYRFGREVTIQALLVKGVSSAHLAFARKAEIPVFKIQGRDLIRAGMKPGPEVGKKLRRLEQAWIKGGFRE